MPAGRPTNYNVKLSAKICDRIADGESIRKICQDPDMPGQRTIYEWLAEHQEFAQQYAIAKEEQADKYAEEMVEIADDGVNDTYQDEEGNQKTNYDVIARSRLRIDTRKWIASKLKPKKYGERITQEVSGPDGGDIPISLKIEFINPK